MMPVNAKHAFYFLLLSILFASCASKQPAAPTAHIPPPPAQINHGKVAVVPASQPRSEIRQQIVNAALGNVGKPYKWGGKTPASGFDCSGLALYSYQTAGISTPRTTTALLNQGKIVSNDQILPGDLLFFSNPKSGKYLHVGIFIGDDQFVHAPGRGRVVTISNLSNPYFQNNFIGVRTFVR